MKPRMKTLVPLSGALVLAILIAGCSSGAQTPLMSTPQNGGNIAQGQSPDRHDGCEDPGDLHVRPCKIVFNANNLGPTNVTVRRDGRGAGNVAERDNCASAGVATIARTGNHTFSVTAGTTAGTCTGRFRAMDDHNPSHRALLTVVNRL